MRGFCAALVAALAAPTAAPRDYPRERAAARNTILGILRSNPEVRRVTSRLSKMVSLKGLQRSKSPFSLAQTAIPWCPGFHLVAFLTLRVLAIRLLK